MWCVYGTGGGVWDTPNSSWGSFLLALYLGHQMAWESNQECKARQVCLNSCALWPQNEFFLNRVLNK